MLIHAPQRVERLLPFPKPPFWSPPTMFVTNADTFTSRHPLPFYLEALNEFRMKRG